MTARPRMCSAQYVSLYDDESCEKVVTVVCRKLNVRAGIGTGYAKVGSVSRSAELHVVEEKDGWYKVLYGNDYAWVCAKYLV